MPEVRLRMERQDVVTTKPPYHVPTLEEVAATPTNGYRVVSTFSGCGGTCLGFRMAGYQIGAASEFIAAARETYHANYPETPIDDRDVRTVSGADLRRLANLSPSDEIDVLEGSPPCASFSTAGKRDAAWGQVKTYSDSAQRSDDLFLEYARLVAELRPRVFVAENVSGLVKGSAKGYFKLILHALKAPGYRVEARLVDASWLGVPQARLRLIFIGVRDDLDTQPRFPTPLPYRYSISDAIANIKNDAAALAEASIVDHAIGREWAKLRPGEQSDRYFQLVRTDPDKPSPTITAAAGNAGTAGVAHPSEPRKFTIAELRRLCAFPDDFALTGTYRQQWERLGRSVPPVMAYHVAVAVRSILDDTNPR